MNLWDLYVLVNDETGTMRTFARIPDGDPSPETEVAGFGWIKLLSSKNREEVQAEMDKYPTVTRARC